MARLRLAILASGRGSNLSALAAEAARPDSVAEIAVVVSDRPGAEALARAEAAGLPRCALPPRDFADREAFDRAVCAKLEQAGAELVCLAGYMRLLSPWFVERWRDRLVNVHPSLLPAFKGLRAVEQAIAAGVRVAGCTVHFVRPEMDCGPILGQAAVTVRDHDDAASLAARILAAEHRLYPMCVRWIAEGRVRIVAGADGAERVELAGLGAEAAALLRP